MCARPLDTHYFPVLYQHKYEMEDGHTATGGAVRYGFDNDLFKDYSWRGYAVYSHIQVALPVTPLSHLISPPRLVTIDLK